MVVGVGSALLGVFVIVFRKWLIRLITERQVCWYGEAGRVVSAFNTPALFAIVGIFFILMGLSFIAAARWSWWPIF